MSRTIQTQPRSQQDGYAGGFVHNFKIAQETSVHVPRVLLDRRRVLESTLRRLGVPCGSLSGIRPGNFTIQTSYDGVSSDSFL